MFLPVDSTLNMNIFFNSEILLQSLPLSKVIHFKNERTEEYPP